MGRASLRDAAQGGVARGRRYSRAVQDPGAPAGRVVAVRSVGPDGGDLGAQQLERGPLAVSIVVDGLPLGELATGTRLRLGAGALVELAEAATGGSASMAPGLVDGGAEVAVTADVREAGLVAPGDPVSLEAIVWAVTDVLDLHSFRPQETSRVVTTYLEEARQAGFAEVRIIHGRGHGVQRAIVRRVLSEAPGVADFDDAPPTRGGWGATVVRLRRVGDTPSA
jgi:hypothetical protein